MEHISGSNEKLENQVLKLLIEKEKTLSTAESCTGGLVSARITAIPGSSAAFLGGVATYSNEAKSILIGVDPDTIKSLGAVSEEVALQMASGVRKKLNSDIGIGITGIAGPASDNTNKPVGLVYVALADKSGSYCRELRLNGTRDEIRFTAANNALDMILEYLMKL